MAFGRQASFIWADSWNLVFIGNLLEGQPVRVRQGALAGWLLADVLMAVPPRRTAAPERVTNYAWGMGDNVSYSLFNKAV